MTTVRRKSFGESTPVSWTFAGAVARDAREPLDERVARGLAGLLTGFFIPSLRDSPPVFHEIGLLSLERGTDLVELCLAGGGVGRGRGRHGARRAAQLAWRPRAEPTPRAPPQMGGEPHAPAARKRPPLGQRLRRQHQLPDRREVAHPQ